jgi:nitrogenase iron protein NifH
MRLKMVKIAIYGKGGIGKSTISANLSAALSEHYRVMQIGCDPKADSTATLLGGVKCPTILSQIDAKGEALTLRDIVFEGFNGTLCAESGGPAPGIGCAGLGIIAAFKKLEELNAFSAYKPDAVIYDVLGDVVCGGFAMPMRGGYAEHVFIVTSGENMALFAAVNIAKAVKSFSSRGYAKLSGVIQNSRNVKNEDKLIRELASDINADVIARIGRSDDVQTAESLGKTVIDALPECKIAGEYRALADSISKICGFSTKKAAFAYA